MSARRVPGTSAYKGQRQKYKSQTKVNMEVEVQVEVWQCRLFVVQCDNSIL